MIRKLLAALSVLFLLPACATAESAPQPRPAMWKVADHDTTIYLFGTVHMLPDNFAWRTRTFDKALAQADTLVLEIADNKDPSIYAGLMEKMAYSPDLPPLLERVPEDKREGLRAIVEKTRIPLAALDRMETWAAAITLAAMSMRDLDVSPANGIETQLSTSFSKTGKPIAGLETTEEQLGFFDSLPETVQRAFLVSVVDSNATAREDFAAMVNAWASGDTAKIAETFDDELRLSPELNEALLKRRNANWAAWTKKRLETPGTVMVAVGAGHLAGPDSVQALLEKEGLTVSRVQ